MALEQPGEQCALLALGDGPAVAVGGALAVAGNLVDQDRPLGKVPLALAFEPHAGTCEYG
jgi:hypothetical protein